jgi:hypothetical protein
MPYFKGTKMFDAKLVGFSMGKTFSAPIPHRKAKAKFGQVSDQSAAAQ